MKRTNLFLMISLLMSGCSANKNDIEVLNINKIASDIVNSTDIFTDIRIVPLETQDESLVGRIGNIIIKNGHIYIADRSTVFKFDENGVFESKISRQGRGPGEYYNITDFQIGGNDNPLVYCDLCKKIFEYDWSGTLVNTTDVDFYGYSIFLANDSSLFIFQGSNGEKHKVCQYKDNVLINSYIYLDDHLKEFLHTAGLQNFSTFNGCTYFYERYNDTVYQLVNDEFVPKFVVNYNGRNIPKSYFERNYSDMREFVNTIDNQFVYGIYSFLETDSQYYVQYSTDLAHRHTALIKKEDGQSIDFLGIKENKYLKNYEIEYKFSYNQGNGEVVYELNGCQIMEYANANLSKEDAAAVAKAISYSGEDQNPILLIGKLK